MAIDENDPIMQQHFKHAGIEDEAPAGADTSEGSGEGNETTQGADAGTESGEAKTTPDATGDKQTPPAKTGAGDANDGGKKPDAKQEAKGAGNPGDLKGADGAVIARAGPERRFYEQLQTSRQQVAAQERQLTEMRNTTQTLQTQLQAAQQSIASLGAESPVEAANALRLYKDLKHNPVQAVTTLLAELKARGHNIEGIGSAVDTAAIQRMIEARLPSNSGQQGPSQQEIDAQAEREVATFFATYPDAVTHDALLADIVTKHPNLSLETAYFQLKQSAQARGLDWTKDLLPQIQASQAAPAPGATTPTTPMVNGRGGVATAAVVKGDQYDPTSGGETLDDIIRDELRKAGIAK